MMGAAAVASVATGAHADGHYAARSAAAMSSPVNWGGLYIGGHLGARWNDIGTVFTDPTPNTRYDVSTTDFVYGGHIGLQRQYGRVVLGIEGGITGSNHDRSSTICPDPTYVCSNGSTGALYTVGARVGLPMGHMMPYITGGYANGEFKYRAVSATGSQEDTTRHGGWYLGGGVDWQLRPNWILGLEYRHYDFQSETGLGVVTGTGTPNAFRTTPDSDSLMLRLSYKFGERTEYTPLK